MEDYNVLPDEMQSGAPTEGKRRKAGETTTTTVVSANPLELRQAEGMAQATVAIEERRAASEVVAQVQAAMMFPRSFSDVKMRLKDLCGQVSVAEKAVYSYSRGGTSVSGRAGSSILPQFELWCTRTCTRQRLFGNASVLLGLRKQLPSREELYCRA